MAHAQKPDFVFRRNGRVHLNRRGRQFSRLLAADGVRISGNNAGYTMFRGSVRVLTTHSIRQFPLHFPSRVSPCAITFQLDSTPNYRAEIAVKRPATGWKVQGSNPGGGEIFRTPPDRPWVPPSFLNNGYRDFPGG
jgi:hypothetical protein